jgi:hypothetical protein
VTRSLSLSSDRRDRSRPVSVRPVVLTGALVLAGLGAAGCNSSALSKQELVVTFDPNAPASEHAAALQACAHATPEATPEPIVTSSLPSSSVGDVRFRVDHANDRALALLTECLNQQPGVKGVDIPDLTN